MKQQRAKTRKYLPASSAWIAILLVAAVSVWVGSGYLAGQPDKTANEKTADDNPRPLPLVTILSSVAQPRSKEITLLGLTEAFMDIQVRAETSGRIQSRPVIKGNNVAKNATLVTLTMDDRLERKQQAEALYEYQTIAYSAAKKLSQKQFQSKVKLAREKADLARAKAELARINLDIRRTTIKAPLSGIVEDLPVDVGERVTIGDVVARIITIDQIKVTGAVSEGQIRQLKKGDYASITLPDGETRTGDIIYLSKKSIGATRTFRIEISVDNPDKSIVAGLTTELRLQGKRKKGHFVSPSVLTLNNKGQLGVKIVDGENRVQFKTVEILTDTPAGLWITGLADKVNIISNGQGFVKVGQKVRTTPDLSTANGPPS